MLTRRALLTAGGVSVAAVATGVGLVEGGVVPGRSRIHAALGLDGPDGRIPSITPGPRITGTFPSVHRGVDVGWVVSYPPGVEPGVPLPVLLTLHGKSGDQNTAFDGLGLHRFQAEGVANGLTPFAVASVAGGSSYWHRRADGTDSGAMVTDEFVPLLAKRGLDTSRVALLGWSMGGYGALLLGSTDSISGVRAIGAMSAALWTRASDAARGAFDGARDFADHDVFERREQLSRVPLRMDCGNDDPFRDANEAFVDGMDPRPVTKFAPGAHTDGYWRRVIPDQLRFLVRRLG